MSCMRGTHFCTFLPGRMLSLTPRNARNYMHAQFDKRHEVYAKSKRKPPRYNLRVSVGVWVILKVRIRVTLYVSLRRRVGRTLYDNYCPYFLPEVMVKFTKKARGHFVTLIKSSMHLTECNVR